MYFYNEGECITNSESALTKADAFAREETDKVIYIQNGCVQQMEQQAQAGQSTEKKFTYTSTERD
jgi:hypothetical protein